MYLLKNPLQCRLSRGGYDLGGGWLNQQQHQEFDHSDVPTVGYHAVPGTIGDPLSIREVLGEAMQLLLQRDGQSHEVAVGRSGHSCFCIMPWCIGAVIL